MVAEAEENNLSDKAFDERWKRWAICGLCEQNYHGSQMSRHYRQRLYRQRRFASRGRPLQPNAPGHVSYDACEMYDVDAVEAMLVRSRLFQRCPTLRTFQEGDVSNLVADAGPINGTYCRRYRDAAVATRASFNENPWELMRNNNR